MVFMALIIVGWYPKEPSSQGTSIAGTFSSKKRTREADPGAHSINPRNPTCGMAREAANCASAPFGSLTSLMGCSGDDRDAILHRTGRWERSCDGWESERQTKTAISRSLGGAFSAGSAAAIDSRYRVVEFRPIVRNKLSSGGEGGGITGVAVSMGGTRFRFLERLT